MSRSKAASAVAALSALVALLSLMKSVRPCRPISSSRCGRPGKVLSAAATSLGLTPSAIAAALAASAFWALCRPRSWPMPARSAKAPSGPVHGARATSSVPTAYQPCEERERTETRSTQVRLASRRRSAMSRHQSSSSPITGCCACATRRPFSSA